MIYLSMYDVIALEQVPKINNSASLLLRLRVLSRFVSLAGILFILAGIFYILECWTISRSGGGYSPLG